MWHDSRTGSSLRRLLYVEDDGLQDELEAEDERDDGEHDRAGRRRAPRQHAQSPVVRAEADAPGEEQQPQEEEERDGREVAQHVLPVNPPPEARDEEQGEG